MTHESLEAIERRAELVVENIRGLLEDLVKIRKRHGFSQEQLAERMGVSQSAVSQMERYDANPTLSSIERYAIAVGARVVINTISDLYPTTSASAAQWTDPHAVNRKTRVRVKTRPAKTAADLLRVSEWMKIPA